MRINSIFVTLFYLLSASFVFAGGKAIPIPLPDEVFKVENDQSVQKTVTVATVEYRPTSPVYVVRGQVQYHDVEGTAYLEMRSVMPDGNRYFTRTLEEPDTGPMPRTNGSMQRICGTSEWRDFTLPFNLMKLKPESVTLEINIVMPGKGTIEVTGLTVSELPIFAGGDWFPPHTGGMIGGIVGTFWGIYGGTVGGLCGFLVPRGKGRRWLTGLILFGFVMTILQLVIGIMAFLFCQPYHIWYPLILCSGIMLILTPMMFSTIKKGYEQAELRKMQALDM